MIELLLSSYGLTVIVASTFIRFAWNPEKSYPRWVRGVVIGVLYAVWPITLIVTVLNDEFDWGDGDGFGL